MERVKKIISFCLVLILAAELPLFAGTEGLMLRPVPASPQNNLSSMDRLPPLLRDFPYEYGRIKRIFYGKKQKWVIHIQDAHTSEEAQLNIARLLKKLAKKNSVKMIAMEGASGELRHQLFSSYPDAKARRLVSRYLLKQGILNGPEYFTIAHAPEMKLVGVEDPVLYEKNRRAFLEALEFKDKDLLLVRDLRTQVDKKIPAFLPHEWLSLRRKERGLFLDSEQFLYYLKELQRLAGKCQYAEKLPAFAQLEQLLKSEEKLNPKDSEKMMDEIGGNLFDEIETVKDFLKEKILKSKEEKKIENFLKTLDILEKIFKFSISKEEADYFYQNRNHFTAEFLKEELRHLRMGSDPAVLAVIDQDISKIQEFYDFAVRRDDPLVELTVKALKGFRQKVCFLVTGGFHTPGIEERLKNQGYSYLVVEPRIKTGGSFENQEETYAKNMQMRSDLFSEQLRNIQWFKDSGLENDASFQLLTPRILPSVSELDGKFSKGGAFSSHPENVRLYEFIPKFMISLALTHIRSAGITNSKVLDSLKPPLMKAERAYLPLYRLLHSPEAVVVRQEEAGFFLTPRDPELGMAISGSWKPSSPSRQDHLKMAVRRDLVMSTQDHVTTQIDVIQEPALYSIALKRINAIKKTELERQQRLFLKTPTVKSPRFSFRFSSNITSEEIKILRSKFDQPKLRKVLSEKTMRLSRRAPPIVDVFVSPKPSMAEMKIGRYELRIKTREKSGSVILHAPLPKTSRLSDVKQPEIQVKLGIPAQVPKEQLLEIPGVFAFPEIIGVLAGVFFGGLSFSAFSLGIAAALAFRAGYTGALLWHEWSHLGVGTVFLKNLEGWTSENILGYQSVKKYFQGLLPFQPLASSAYVQLSRLASWQESVTRHAGWIGSALLTGGILGLGIFTGLLTSPMFSFAWAGVLAGTGLVLAKGFISDTMDFGGDCAGVYACGNLGILSRRNASEPEIIPKRIHDNLQAMGKVTKIRGEQAAGSVAFVRRGNHVHAVRERVVNPKRKDLSEELRDAFEKKTQPGFFFGPGPTRDAYLVMQHYRYGTSSPPAETETHPHQWMPERTVEVWQMHDGRFVKSRESLTNFITHNGDFDEWLLFGNHVPVDQIGLWLERVLHTANMTSGDSPKVAGMMDLLITQGMWEASVRLAYQLEVAGSLRETFGGQEPSKTAPDTAPSQTQLEQWADLFEKTFESYQDRLLRARNLNDLKDVQLEDREDFKRILFDKIRQDSKIHDWNPEKTKWFINRAVDSFFENDLYGAMKLFMSRAKGSFGLIAVSSLQPDTLAIGARYQPISLGFHPEEGLIAYVSEPAALKAVKDTKGQSIPYRFDLDSVGGEIAEISLDHVRIYSESLQRELTEAEISGSGRLVEMKDNDYITALDLKETEDLVGDDIREIPKVLVTIKEDWENPESYNRQTAEEFLRLIQEKEERSSNQHTDVLILGTESSHWIGEKFASNLKAMIPGLNVESVWANEILDASHLFNTADPSGAVTFQKDSRLISINRNTVVLAVSQSGQTFGTLNAAALLRKFLKDRVFVMSGELDNLTGMAVGQSYTKGAPFNRRIFSNLSGLRPSEPATAANIAMHQTLTELLLFLSREIQKSPAAESVYDMGLEEEDLEELIRLKGNFIRQTANITGVTERGDDVDAKEHLELVAQGKKWAQHVLEPAKTWGLASLYTGILIFVGLPLTALYYFIFSFVPDELTIDLPYFGAISVVIEPFVLPLFKTGDFLLAVFFSYLSSLGLRWFEGRTSLARNGKRTLVIGDVPFVHNLLNAYVSKLFALSFGHASIDVHGSNPKNEMTHLFGHRIVRGTLLYIGRPDGRMESQRKAESYVLMTAKQAKGVQNLGVGAEVVSVGHNPAVNPNAVDNGIQLWKPGFPRRPEVEGLAESLFDSAERLIAGYVMFHAMAKEVSHFWPLQYDMHRSQSGTRVATTAAPVSAAEIKIEKTENGAQGLISSPLPFRVLSSAEVPESQGQSAKPLPASEPISASDQDLRALYSKLEGLTRNLVDELSRLKSKYGRAEDFHAAEIEKTESSDAPKNPRHELREASPEDLFRGLKETTDWKRRISLSHSILTPLLRQRGAAFTEGAEAPAQPILIYADPEIISTAALARFLEVLKEEKAMPEIYLIQAPGTDLEAWNYLRRNFVGAGLKIHFENAGPSGDLETYLEHFLTARKLDRKTMIQLSDSSPIKVAKTASDERTEDLLTSAVALSQQTAVLIGASRPIEGVAELAVTDFLDRLAEVRQALQTSA